MALTERREEPRGRFRVAQDLVFTVLRAIARHASSFYTALGIYLVAGAVIAVFGTWLFAELAGQVQSGATQRFDDSVLRWMAVHRVRWIERSLLEITALGTGLVLATMVLVAALFLSLTEHRFSALLLLVSTGGGLVLNSILKASFDRARPEIFEWGTQTMSSSFPSGHAMNSAVVYGTIAYLLAHLEKRRWERLATMLVAFSLVAVICVSRLYLGVHYPSDVLGGVVIGLAWAGFCMAGLGVARVFARRFRAPVIEHERDLHPAERQAAGFDA